MTELELKYGCNPNQKPARIFMEEGELPIQVLNGKPGYINFLDAFNSWQLVEELEEATGLPLCPRPGCRPAVLLRRLGRPLRCVRRRHRPLPGPGGIRRRDRPWLHRRGPGHPQNQAQGRL